MQNSLVFDQVADRHTIFEIGAAILSWLVGRSGRCDEGSEGHASEGTQRRESPLP
jgi:hypothetical protein